MITIDDRSDKGLCLKSKKLKYEVGDLHKENDVNEIPEIHARFRSYWDANAYATSLSYGYFYYKKIVIRNRY